MTVRTRLTLLYSLMVIAGGLLLVLAIYLLLRANLVNQLQVTVAQKLPAAAERLPAAQPAQPAAQAVAVVSSNTVLAKLLLVSGISLLTLAVIAAAVGWWVSGRVLRPLHRISATARRLSSDNLHERIALAGPRDELTELAETFDEMLDRLEAAFDSQRRFVANASHELRTPLAIQRAAVQIGLPDADPEIVARLLAANRRSERLIDGLLLARSDRGLEHREPVPLHEVAREVLVQHADDIAAGGLRVTEELGECWVSGDPVLVGQLVDNLVGNAVRYNEPGGELCVRTGEGHGLSVLNSGQRVEEDQVPELFEPFRRGSGRGSTDGGSGLGLSIVRSIVQAHGGSVSAEARPGGGLTVHVTLPESAPVAP
ncbi:sensor histidine kinase [Amycolatopsis sacchari]|uniref:sensor histidine kinase n=1 Tax=Amycolatopsis sacchari TaxID=115433 RepID=UPI003EB87A23